MTFRFPPFIAVALLVTACTPKVQFDEPMPPSRWNLPNIPKDYRGTFLDEVGQVETVIGKDTIRTGEDVMVNGEDFLLRRMAGHLVYSQPVPETGQWEVYVLRKEGEDMVLGAFKDNDAFLRRMATLLEVDPERLKAPGKPGYKYTLLRPSAKEFKTILKERLYEEEAPKPLPKGGVIKP